MSFYRSVPSPVFHLTTSSTLVIFLLLECIGSSLICSLTDLIWPVVLLRFYLWSLYWVSNCPCLSTVCEKGQNTRLGLQTHRALSMFDLKTSSSFPPRILLYILAIFFFIILFYRCIMRRSVTWPTWRTFKRDAGPCLSQGRSPGVCWPPRLLALLGNDPRRTSCTLLN